MKFLFISPYDERCVGLRSIGAVLEDAGHEIHFLHIEGFLCQFVPFQDRETSDRILRENPLIARDVEPLGDIFINSQQLLDSVGLELLLNHVDQIKPNVIGISAWIGLDGISRQMTQAIRRLNPSISVIWGGNYPTLFPDEALRDCDMICVGEGELPVLTWAGAPHRIDIPGLWQRRGDEVHRNGPAPSPDLNELPFPIYGHNEWTLTGRTLSSRQMDDPYQLGRNVVFISDRYCRCDCAYCLSGRMRRACKDFSPRRKTVDRFLDEIEHVANVCRLPELIAFWDDNFAENVDWVEEFAAKYPKRIGIPFAFNTHPSLTKLRAIELLCEAGATEIAFGLQSGSRRVLREVYKRDPDVEKLIDAAHFASKCGVKRLQIDLITNNPYETDEDCRETFETLLKLPRPCDVHIAKLVIYPGSRLAQYEGPLGGLSDRTLISGTCSTC